MADDLSPRITREVVRQSLEQIFQSHGELSPELVLHEARSPEHPLHNSFEWDNNEAGRQYRLLQAAGMIRSVKIQVVRERATGEIEDHSIRAWLPASHVGQNLPPGAYVPVAEVDETGRAIMLRRMMREIMAMRERYGHLVEFWQEIDKDRPV